MTNLQIEDARLETAVVAAKRAGQRASSVKHTTNTDEKGNGTIVTEADREAESTIRDELKNSYEYPILGEEFGGDIENTDTYWVVDPIDGTRNFANKQPLYGTAIALVEDGEPTVGVFYMPELDNLFYAVDGKGAYRNQTKITVSEETDFSNAYYTISGIGRTKLHPHVSQLNRWIQQLGCALMSESWIASGWADVGVFGAFGPWDVAVGVILIREADGVVKTISSHSTDWEEIKDGRIVLGNEELVDSVLTQLPNEVEKIVNNATYEY